MKNSDAQNTAVPNLDAQNLDALFAVFFPVVHLIVRLRAHTFKIIPVERLHTTRKIEKPGIFGDVPEIPGESRQKPQAAGQWTKKHPAFSGMFFVPDLFFAYSSYGAACFLCFFDLFTAFSLSGHTAASVPSIGIIFSAVGSLLILRERRGFFLRGIPGGFLIGGIAFIGRILLRICAVGSPFVYRRAFILSGKRFQLFFLLQGADALSAFQRCVGQVTHVLLLIVAKLPSLISPNGKE